jgi:26S proteasome regulatory subunit T3
VTDLYLILKEKEKHLEFLDIKEEYVKDEMKNLKRELIRAKEVFELLRLIR